MLSIQILFVYSTLINFNQFVHAGTHQKRLLHKLFENYDPLERPTKDENSNLKVELGISIQQIIDIDEKKQTMVSSGWLDMTWNDYNLKWNPRDYGNITALRVSSTKIWIPDILLFNSADESFDPKYGVNAVLNYDGEVNYLPPGMFRSICQIDIYQFPFDEQFCTLKFGSWTYDELTVNLTNKSDNAQLDSYIENGEWALEKCESYSKSIKYECCPTKYPFVMFTIHIRRRTLYYIFNLVFPCVLISFMSVLGFTLPPDSGEKIGLEIITLLSIIMFSQFFMGIIPESSLSVPKIALYFASVIVISAMSIITNVLVIILHHKNVNLQNPLPAWAETWICGYLAKCLLMKRANKKIENTLKRSLVFKEETYKNNIFTNGTTELNGRSKAGSESLIKHELSTFDDDELSIKSNFLNQILKELQIITKKMKIDQEEEDRGLDWKFAAMVIDRLCLVIFTLATFISTAGILLTAKNFFKFR